MPVASTVFLYLLAPGISPVLVGALFQVLVQSRASVRGGTGGQPGDGGRHQQRPGGDTAGANPVSANSASGTPRDRKSTRLNSSHANISYAVFCLKKKT